MLDIYITKNGHLCHVDGLGSLADESLVWIDLHTPNDEETAAVQRLIEVSIPTLDEMRDIEVSSRLYHEHGASLMTMTAAVHLDTDTPTPSPLTFILKGKVLVSIRYVESKSFSVFATRSSRPSSDIVSSGDAVMLGLLEAMTDRMADALEATGTHLTEISREIFRRGKTQQSANLQQIISILGQHADLIGLLQESLVSISRLLSFRRADGQALAQAPQALSHALQRDVVALSDHASFLSDKVSLLLDATMGLINLEQNQIIKIFSVAAVCLMPPTLVASIYGMNFHHMPELGWHLGYPLAIMLMLLSGLLPILYFKRKGWF